MSQERQIKGKNFAFFGGTTGIGYAAAREIAKRGGNVLLVGRNKAAGASAVDGLLKAGAASAAFLPGDLSTLQGMATVAQGVKQWKGELHGVVHTAMTAFKGKQITEDGLEFSFALQYMARAVLNRLLVNELAASGDGRVVHVAGDVPAMFMPDLDDLQFEKRKFSFFKAIMGTHMLGFLHLQEAQRLWNNLPLTFAASCVGPTKTNAMADPAMPLIMRIMGRFGTTAEVSVQNSVRLLTEADARDARSAILRKPKVYKPTPINMDQEKASRLWSITTDLAAKRGVTLP